MWWGAAGVLLLLTLACCCWYGRDIPVEKPQSGLYSFQGPHKHTSMESQAHNLRAKEPVELEELSDRLVIASCAPAAGAPLPLACCARCVPWVACACRRVGNVEHVCTMMERGGMQGKGRQQRGAQLRK